MTTDAISKQVPVLCDHDALYAAIELKLNALPHVRVIRLGPNPPGQPAAKRPNGMYDLIIVAPVPPISDPLSVLKNASLLGQVGQVPVLVVSEQPSRSETDDKITYLNFPYDMDDLTGTVVRILDERLCPEPEEA
jgi:hypothetical protein